MMCSTLLNTADLAALAGTCANNGKNPISKKQIVNNGINEEMMSVMMTCGMYNGAGDSIALCDICHMTHLCLPEETLKRMFVEDHRSHVHLDIVVCVYSCALAHIHLALKKKLQKNFISKIFFASKILFFVVAGNWMVDVGIPAKSGVGGAIFGVVPGICGTQTHTYRIYI